MKRSVGALLSCASSTSRTTRAMVLSAASLVTRTRNAASPLIVPAKTVSSTPLRFGTLSPVTGASSMALSPCTITPSAGMRSPGRTRMIASTASVSAGTSRGLPVFQQQRCLRHQRRQPLDAGAGAACGNTFQQLADQEQEHDRRGLFGRTDDDRADGRDRHQHFDRERRTRDSRREGPSRHRHQTDAKRRQKGDLFEGGNDLAERKGREQRAAAGAGQQGALRTPPRQSRLTRGGGGRRTLRLAPPSQTLATRCSQARSRRVQARPDRHPLHG